MTDRNYVAMEQNICPVCGITHEYNTGILLDRHLKDIPDDKRVTGYSLCEEHSKLFEEGYIALVVIDESKSIVNKEKDTHDNIKSYDAYRTGNVLHMKRVVFNDIFNSQLSEKQEMVFIGIDLFDKLKEMETQSNENNTEKQQ